MKKEDFIKCILLFKRITKYEVLRITSPIDQKTKFIYYKNGSHRWKIQLDVQLSNSDICEDHVSVSNDVLMIRGFRNF